MIKQIYVKLKIVNLEQSVKPGYVLFMNEKYTFMLMNLQGLNMCVRGHVVYNPCH